MGSLFPGLPDEVGWECLLRVELNSHHNLRGVCKRWNDVLKNPHFYQERKRLKISEQRICMVVQDTEGIRDRVAVYDLEKNSCKCLPRIPAQIKGMCHCYFLKQKLVLITDSIKGSERSCVWLYDFACSKWRQGAQMPRRLYSFASAADEHRGLIYVGGGYERGHRHHRATVYNVEEDNWDFLPYKKTSGSIGAFANGKFYVMGSSGIFKVFNSYMRSWTALENRVNRSHHCFVSAFGRFYGLSVNGLFEYDFSPDKLNVVGTFSMKNMGWFIHFAVVFSNKLFVRKLDSKLNQGFYMLEPPSETGGTFKLIEVERPLDLQGSAVCATTLDL
ncbi:F-box/kelch-repeat protein At1g80440 [Cryptomeria japonica]|uniref:F-box/kelch-repeat protein At1g80440 n=1 Tax=Cryptomeria japonica TaxID=3369 RepID=UPI0025AD61ED|nr:F-box/kelch-repeat protein At1g80440 [Cryptomeria japonica]